MIDLKRNPVYRGSLLIDFWGDMWVVMLPAGGNYAHLQNVRTGRKVRGHIRRFLVAPKDKKKHPDMQKWYRKEMIQ